MDLTKLFKKVAPYFVLVKKSTFVTAFFAVYLGVTENCFTANAQFFQNITNKIENNVPRLSYGVAVTDLNGDGKMEFIVTGFRYPNLALSYENGSYKNINSSELFADEKRSSIGVVACDVDQDGYEEIYFLNTDTYSGKKKYSDILLDDLNIFSFHCKCRYSRNKFPHIRPDPHHMQQLQLMTFFHQQIVH